MNDNIKSCYNNSNSIVLNQVILFLCFSTSLIGLGTSILYEHGISSSFQMIVIAIVYMLMSIITIAGFISNFSIKDEDLLMKINYTILIATIILVIEGMILYVRNGIIDICMSICFILILINTIFMSSVYVVKLTHEEMNSECSVALFFKLSWILFRFSFLLLPILLVTIISKNAIALVFSIFFVPTFIWIWIVFLVTKNNIKKSYD